MRRQQDALVVVVEGFRQLIFLIHLERVRQRLESQKAVEIFMRVSLASLVPRLQGFFSIFTSKVEINFFEGPD